MTDRQLRLLIANGWLTASFFVQRPFDHWLLLVAGISLLVLSSFKKD